MILLPSIEKVYTFLLLSHTIEIFDVVFQPHQIDAERSFYHNFVKLDAGQIE